jgi:hypothetical protein
LHPIAYGAVHDKLYRPSTFLSRAMPYKLLLTILKGFYQNLLIRIHMVLWNGKKPILSYLKDLRCDAYVKHIVSENIES